MMNRIKTHKHIAWGIMVVLGVSLQAPLRAGVDTGADFLKIPLGARGIALGQAATALTRQAESLTWNAAGIAPDRSPGLSSQAMNLMVSHQALFDSNNLDHVGLVFPTRWERWTGGFSITRLAYPDQIARNADRQETGSFGASDLAVGFAAAVQLGSHRIGTHLRLIRQELADIKADGASVDLGYQRSFSHVPLALGLTVRNAGPSMRFLEESFRLPLTLSAGAAYRFRNPIVLSLDVHARPHQRQTFVSLGTELMPMQTLTLRAGYLAKLAEAVRNGQTDETNRGNFAGLDGITGGVGFQIRQLTLDYAVSPFGELGNTHTFTISVSFGGSGVSSLTTINDESPAIAEPAVQPQEPLLLDLPISSDQPFEPTR